MVADPPLDGLLNQVLCLSKILLSFEVEHSCNVCSTVDEELFELQKVQVDTSVCEHVEFELKFPLTWLTLLQVRFQGEVAIYLFSMELFGNQFLELR